MTKAANDSGMACSFDVTVLRRLHRRANEPGDSRPASDGARAFGCSLWSFRAVHPHLPPARDNVSILQRYVPMKNCRRAAYASVTAAFVLGAGVSFAAPGDSPVPPLPVDRAPDDTSRVQTTSLPAHGLFVGDQLSETAKAELSELIVNALGLQVEVALVVPEGPWKIDGSGKNENDLTPARLAAVRRFLAARGVDPKRIFVESRIDPRLKAPRLEVQMVGQPTPD
jgi:OmpA-OmpF porin, OOP family